MNGTRSSSARERAQLLGLSLILGVLAQAVSLFVSVPSEERQAIRGLVAGVAMLGSAFAAAVLLARSDSREAVETRSRRGYWIAAVADLVTILLAGALAGLPAVWAAASFSEFETLGRLGQRALGWPQGIASPWLGLVLSFAFHFFLRTRGSVKRKRVQVDPLSLALLVLAVLCVAWTWLRLGAMAVDQASEQWSRGVAMAFLLAMGAFGSSSLRTRKRIDRRFRNASVVFASGTLLSFLALSWFLAPRLDDLDSYDQVFASEGWTIVTGPARHRNGMRAVFGLAPDSQELERIRVVGAREDSQTAPRPAGKSLYWAQQKTIDRSDTGGSRRDVGKTELWSRPRWSGSPFSTRVASITGPISDWRVASDEAHIAVVSLRDPIRNSRCRDLRVRALLLLSRSALASTRLRLLSTENPVQIVDFGTSSLRAVVFSETPFAGSDRAGGVEQEKLARSDRTVFDPPPDANGRFSALCESSPRQSPFLATYSLPHDRWSGWVKTASAAYPSWIHGSVERGLLINPGRWRRLDGESLAISGTLEPPSPYGVNDRPPLPLRSASVRLFRGGPEDWTLLGYDADGSQLAALPLPEASYAALIRALPDGTIAFAWRPETRVGGYFPTSGWVLDSFEPRSGTRGRLADDVSLFARPYLGPIGLVLDAGGRLSLPVPGGLRPLSNRKLSVRLDQDD